MSVESLLEFPLMGMENFAYMIISFCSGTSRFVLERYNQYDCTNLHLVVFKRTRGLCAPSHLVATIKIITSLTSMSTKIRQHTHNLVHAQSSLMTGTTAVVDTSQRRHQANCLFVVHLLDLKVVLDRHVVVEVDLVLEFHAP